MSAYFYILRCSDGSYYAGTSRDSLEIRVGQHQSGILDGYTAIRRPVTLVFHQEFSNVEDAIAAERQVKGWRRDKKEALIRGILRYCRRWRVAALAPALRKGRCVLRDALLRSAPQSPTQNES